MNWAHTRNLLAVSITLLLLTGCTSGKTPSTATTRPSPTPAGLATTAWGDYIWNFEGLLGRELGNGRWCVDDFAPSRSAYITTIWFTTGPACSGINPHTLYRAMFKRHTTSVFTVEPESWSENSKFTLDPSLKLVLVNRSAVRCDAVPHTYLVLGSSALPLDLQCRKLVTIK